MDYSKTADAQQQLDDAKAKAQVRLLERASDSKVLKASNYSVNRGCGRSIVVVSPPPLREGMME
jgi:hypothetical protein